MAWLSLSCRRCDGVRFPRRVRRGGREPATPWEESWDGPWGSRHESIGSRGTWRYQYPRRGTTADHRVVRPAVRGARPRTLAPAPSPTVNPVIEPRVAEVLDRERGGRQTQPPGAPIARVVVQMAHEPRIPQSLVRSQIAGRAYARPLGPWLGSRRTARARPPPGDHLLHTSRHEIAFVDHERDVRVVLHAVEQRAHGPVSTQKCAVLPQEPDRAHRRPIGGETSGERLLQEPVPHRSYELSHRQSCGATRLLPADLRPGPEPRRRPAGRVKTTRARCPPSSARGSRRGSARAASGASREVRSSGPREDQAVDAEGRGRSKRA